MKPHIARLLDDLLAKSNRKKIYKFIRDAQTADLAELLGGIERRIDTEEGRDAMIGFAWLMIETRSPFGSAEARDRDHLAESLRMKKRRKSPLSDG